MTHTDFPPFHFGQRVVAIKDSGELELLNMLPYKKGDEFVVSVIKQDPTFKIWHMSFMSRPTDEYYMCSFFAPIEENRERIKYVAVSETLREKAQEVVIENLTTS